ncbi:MAG: flagellar motor protein MotB [Helicobacteraceae bacterium]|jgi:chemotaxis protein MotB|nr:flagellar motor protein MotB [Helicobacteraceae bacterium]
MAKKKELQCPPGVPRWLVQFGDMMSLLLVFFILLLSMSTIDAKKVNEAMGSLNGALSVLEGGTQSEVSRERMQLATPIVKQSESDEVVNRVTVTISEFNEIIRRQGGEETVQIEEAIQGFMIRLPAGILFRPGSASVISADAKLLLKRIAMLASRMPKDMRVVVQGHADDLETEAGNPEFRDKWTLSTARAVSVVKELIADGMPPEKLAAEGLASYKPIATNATEEGRARNRRVEIHFMGESKSSESKAPKSILDVP